mgnify:FL=1
MQKALLIEDEEDVRETIRSMLFSAGFEVTEAKDGREGVTQFRLTNPDVIVTDILMPGREGIETIMEIRSENTEVPIVAISGGGQYLNDLLDNMLQSAELLGATRSISKPFRRKEFLKVVTEAVNVNSR